MGRVREGRRLLSCTAELHTQEPRYESPFFFLLFGSKSPWLKQTSGRPRKLSWSLLLLQPADYTIHVIKLPSSMPPTQFTQHFHREHMRPVYFRYQMYFLLFSFQQGPTSATASTDIEGVNIQHKKD